MKRKTSLMESGGVQTEDERQAEFKRTQNITRATAPVQLRTLLVPWDFSDYAAKALDYAVAFARQFDARVVLLHVIEPAVYADTYLATPTVYEQINQDMVSAAKDRLSALMKDRFRASDKVECIVKLGQPDAEIAEAAREMEVDLIIQTTHGYTGLKHVLLGSTAERVVRHAPCPVLTVRSPEHEFVTL